VIDDRSGLMTLAGDRDAGMTLLIQSDGQQLAGLLHGLLALYDAAIRETCTDLGRLAVGAYIEEVAETVDTSGDPYGVIQEAARLIVAHGAARPPDADNEFSNHDVDFANLGAELFNTVIDRIGTEARLCEITCAVATVWRNAAPWLHNEAGLEILRRVTW
jgi:hypothetical protein